ncbi:MAG: glycosyltransferase [Bacilli bacterium]|nr:glycosyltransferase [Bacilli bacterium]
MAEQYPLVSVIVITYNSAKYVLETLESVRVQTYQNIELIVSDDCSFDNTVEICHEWIKANKGRFVRTELLTIEKNTGIASNCNRGVRACRGEIIKLIAGDDVLVESSVKNAMCFFHLHSDIEVIFGKAYGIDENSKVFREYIPNIRGKFRYENFLSGKISYNITTVFYRSKVHDKIGYYEEGVYAEDIYFSRKIWMHCKVAYLDWFLTYYRTHSKNITKNVWLMYQEALKSLNVLKNDKYYKIKLKREYLNFFVLLSKDHKRESLKYLIPNLRFWYDRLFWIGLFYLLNLHKLFQKLSK